MSAFRAPAPLTSLAVVVAAPDAAGTTWVLAACADDGATATLRYDRRSGMACVAAPAGGCAGVATAKDGFVAFGATAVRKLTARKVAEPAKPAPPPPKPLEDGAAALEATLRNIVDGKSAEPLSSIFAAAPSSQIQKAATAVIAAPYASSTQARAALDAAIEGLMEEVDDEQKVNAERLLQSHRVLGVAAMAARAYPTRQGVVNERVADHD